MLSNKPRRLTHPSWSLFASLVCLATALLAPLQAQQLTLPVKPNSVRFAAIGDMGTGESAQYEVAQQMTAYRQKFPFDFVIMLGDNIYGGHDPSDFEQKFSLPYKALLDAGVTFYAALGNHDDPNERFFEPFNMNGSLYYTYKKGNVRFIVLDSDYMDPPQFAWLQSELQKAAGDEWRICYFHHPLYSSGKTHGSSVELRGQIEPLFEQYGVNVVFEGHDHVYERVKPQHGIYYFTEGSAGQLRRGDIRKTDMTAKGFDQDQTFMLVEIASDQLYFQTVTRTGLTIDSGSIQKQTTGKAAWNSAWPAPAGTSPHNTPRATRLTLAAMNPFLSVAAARSGDDRVTAFAGTNPSLSAFNGASRSAGVVEQSASSAPSGQSTNPQSTGPSPANIVPYEPPIKPELKTKSATKSRAPKRKKTKKKKKPAQPKTSTEPANKP